MKQRKMFARAMRFVPNFTIKQLDKEVEKGYLAKSVHPKYSELVLYNYTQHCTFDKHWNWLTLNCRGLVIDTLDKKIVAFPFSKFFNMGEFDSPLTKTIDEPFVVQEKVDGSLGIIFRHGDDTIVCTRGSFISEQSVVAKKMLKDSGLLDNGSMFSNIQPGVTICCEIIYPENRIVVNYGLDKRLDFLAMFDNKTGKQISGCTPLENIDTFDDITHYFKTTENIEGVVVVYENGYRLKLKTEEYMSAHRILYALSQKQTVRSWADEEIKCYLDDLTDDQKELLVAKIKKLDNSYKVIKRHFDAQFRRFKDIERKELYTHFIEKNVPPIVQAYIYARMGKKDTKKFVREFIYKNYGTILDIEYNLQDSWKESKHE